MYQRDKILIQPAFGDAVPGARHVTPGKARAFRSHESNEGRLNTVGTYRSTRMAVANCRATNRVASLMRLSPSSVSTMRLGSPTRRAIEVAAMASVGATTEAPVKAFENSWRQQGNAQNGKPDQAESQEKNADQVASEVAPGGVPSCRIQHEMPGIHPSCSPPRTMTIGYTPRSFCSYAARS